MAPPTTAPAAPPPRAPVPGAGLVVAFGRLTGDRTSDGADRATDDGAGRATDGHADGGAAESTGSGAQGFRAAFLVLGSRAVAGHAAAFIEQVVIVGMIVRGRSCRGPLGASWSFDWLPARSPADGRRDDVDVATVGAASRARMSTGGGPSYQPDISATGRPRGPGRRRCGAFAMAVRDGILGWSDPVWVLFAAIRSSFARDAAGDGRRPGARVAADERAGVARLVGPGRVRSLPIVRGLGRAAAGGPVAGARVVSCHRANRLGRRRDRAPERGPHACARRASSARTP